jgi:hypothetical protein
MCQSDKKIAVFWLFLTLSFTAIDTSAKEIQLAKEAQDNAQRRIEQSKELLDQALDEIRAEANKNVDAILTATNECKKLPPSNVSGSALEDFSGIETELINYQSSLERKKQTLQRISTTRENGSKRACFAGSNEKIESFITCLTAREKSIYLAESIYGMAVLEKIQRGFVNEPFQTYQICGVEKKFLNENKFKNALRSAIKTSAIIQEYSEKLIDFSNKIMSIRN